MIVCDRVSTKKEIRVIVNDVGRFPVPSPFVHAVCQIQLPQQQQEKQINYTPNFATARATVALSEFYYRINVTIAPSYYRIMPPLNKRKKSIREVTGRERGSARLGRCSRNVDGSLQKKRRILQPSDCYKGLGLGVQTRCLQVMSLPAVTQSLNSTFPGYQAVFSFDNSSNHLSYAADALRVENTNPHPGGKQGMLREAFMHGKELPQSMSFAKGYYNRGLAGKPNGIKRVLKERGLWPERGLVLECPTTQSTRL